MAAPHHPSPPPAARSPNPLVLLDCKIKVALWPTGHPGRITAVSLAAPTKHYTWTSRAGLDRGRAYPVVAYIQLRDATIESGHIIDVDGHWELRPGRLDGFDLDVRRLIAEATRREVGAAVQHLAQPALEAWRKQQNGRAAG